MEKNQVYPTDLTDHQWDCIKELIPPAKPGGHPRILNMRAVVNAILYVTVTGCLSRAPRRDGYAVDHRGGFKKPTPLEAATTQVGHQKVAEFGNWPKQPHTVRHR